MLFWKISSSLLPYRNKIYFCILTLYPAIFLSSFTKSFCIDSFFFLGGGFTSWDLGEGNGIPLQYSCLENPMDGGAWWAAVHGVAKSLTQLSNFTFTFYFQALEKEMATHSSVLAWRIPGTEEPGGLLSMGSHRVGHDWSDLAAAAVARDLNSPTRYWIYVPGSGSAES